MMSIISPKKIVDLFLQIEVHKFISLQFWHVLIFLGMACWYQETTISFAEEQTSQCSTTKGFNASTHQIINWIQGQFNQSFPSVMKEVNQEF